MCVRKLQFPMNKDWNEVRKAKRSRQNLNLKLTFIVLFEDTAKADAQNNSLTGGKLPKAEGRGFG